jgi:hypothetical protein
MRTSITINKRIIFVGLSVVLLMLTFALIHKSYAGKPTISLNSPASFPIDI